MRTKDELLENLMANVKDGSPRAMPWLSQQYLQVEVLIDIRDMLIILNTTLNTMQGVKYIPG